jgi:GT2 family glycosyltransferase
MAWQTSQTPSDENVSSGLEYSVVIATLDRPDSLSSAVRSLVVQTHKPARVVVVDSTEREDLTRHRELKEEVAGSFELSIIRNNIRSAAKQRNVGFEYCSTPYVAVIDDDVVLDSDVCSKLLEVHQSEQQTGAVAARERGTGHLKPSRLLLAYYRLQAGFDDPTFGGRLFGPGINCLPCYEAELSHIITTDWLPSTCLMVAREAFHRAGGFPAFAEYSFMEDVWLTASIKKTGLQLRMRSDAMFDHHSQSSSFKQRKFFLARMRIKHRRHLAREVMGVPSALLEAKLTFHKLFDSIYLVRQRSPGWRREMLGTWLA